MAPMSATLQMSAAEFIAAPVPQRGRPWNLVDGEVVVNDPTWTHSDAQSNILMALRRWSGAEPGRGVANSGVDVGIDDRNVFVPDVVWYREGRVSQPDPGPPYPMPDLAVEVRSPSTWRFDIGPKKAGYERHGLPELWLVDTGAGTVLVYRRSGPSAPGFDGSAELVGDDELTSPLLPGFVLDVSGVFS